jgi:hypothetical protein
MYYGVALRPWMFSIQNTALDLRGIVPGDPLQNKQVIRQQHSITVAANPATHQRRFHSRTNIYRISEALLFGVEAEPESPPLSH